MLQHLCVRSLVPGNSKHPKTHQQSMQTYSTELFTSLVSNTHSAASAMMLHHGRFRVLVPVNNDTASKCNSRKTTLHQSLESAKYSTTASLWAYNAVTSPQEPFCACCDTCGIFWRHRGNGAATETMKHKSSVLLSLQFTLPNSFYGDLDKLLQHSLLLLLTYFVQKCQQNNLTYSC